ncbi:MAG: UDP-N-acetylmuramoyl-L-alanine--D-glutamate ligase [Chloroflexi bacterium]|nr:UDP-N-acetylmuramoyl-L-alanine--D-glutamate ligase [Chloroflexota bacterium]
MGKNQFSGQKVLILGLGREGKALARFLSKKGAMITISDLKSKEELTPEIQELNGTQVDYALGGHPENLLDGKDTVFVSPGVSRDIPILKEAQRRGTPLASETRLFFSLCRAPIIGITGSSGKTTTTALVGEMLKASGKEVYIGGNIGTPLLEKVEGIPSRGWVVLELSSFQLENLDTSPEIAAVLNITPNHLDRHHTMEAYIAAKLNILRYQNTIDTAVLGWDNPTVRGLREDCRGRVLFFGLKKMPNGGSFVRDGNIILRLDGQEEETSPLSAVQLRGVHNLQNILAATAIARAAGAEVQAIAQTIRTFTGLEHRLELVREIGGVAYYNDSIATTPERSIAALNSFSEPILLLAGGREKHLPLQHWASLTTEKVRILFLFGEAAPLIGQAVEEAKTNNRVSQPEIRYVTGLESAVEEVHRLSRPGEIVLLSPACASFDMYRDFEERGRHFKSMVWGLDD